MRPSLAVKLRMLTKLSTALLAANAAYALPPELDIGFAQTSTYIQIKVKEDENGGLLYQYWLALDKHAVAISDCWFQEEALAQHFSGIKNRDLRETFARSLNASLITPRRLNEVYGELAKAMDAAGALQKLECRAKPLDPLELSLLTAPE
jgi:hypothetical protein